MLPVGGAQKTKGGAKLMFNLVPFNRKNELTKREDFFNQFFDHFFKDDFLAPFSGAENSIRVDLKETDAAYEITADLPGMKKEDISVELSNDYLTIGAKREEQNEDKGENYLRRERRYGEFKRSFYIRNVRSEGIDAEFKDGVLKITLPKLENRQDGGKTITIR